MKKLIRNPWLEKDDMLLKQNHNFLSYSDLAKMLRRSKSSIKGRLNHLGLTNTVDKKAALLERRGYSKENLEYVVSDCKCVMDVAKKLNKTVCGPTYRIILRALRHYNIDISHFDPWIRNRQRTYKSRPIDFYLIYGSSISSSDLKSRLYKESLKQRKCERCGQGEEWQGEKMSLILDHINGDPKDNRLENLRIVCPNCNATLPTHCRGKRAFVVKEPEVPTEIDLQRERNGGRTDKEIAFSLSQRRIERPSKEVLLADTKELGFKGTGKKYGVSDNSIRKWLK